MRSSANSRMAQRPRRPADACGALWDLSASWQRQDYDHAEKRAAEQPNDAAEERAFEQADVGAQRRAFEQAMLM